MAAGRLAIASYEGGATSLVADGVEGCIVRPCDLKHIAEVIIKVATDSNLNRPMGEAAYRKGAVQNPWQDYGDRLPTEYTTRLNQRSATA